MNLENITIGTYNEFAVKTLQKVCENPGKDYPLLIIEGNKGCGSSSLTRSILERWDQKESIFFINGDNFLREMIDHIQNHSFKEFTSFLENLDILIFDELESLSGRDGSQDCFLKILRNRLENHRQTIITTNKSLSSNEHYKLSLYTLLQGGLRVPILEPTFEDKKLMVRSLAEKHQIKLNDEVLERIALSVKDSFYEIQGTILNLKANKKLLNDDSFLVNIIPPQMKNADPARFLRIPKNSMWFAPDNHPMTSKLESYFEREGFKIKVARIFPGSLLDFFEFRILKSMLDQKIFGEVVSKFGFSIGVSNLSFWDYVSDPTINSDRMAIQIPKNCYDFKLPKVKFHSTGSKKIQNSHTLDSRDQYYFIVSKSIEEKLGEFNVNARIINVIKGPVVVTFELETGHGVKVSSVLNHAEELKGALMGLPIRILFPVKGSSTIHIEVPRKSREMVSLEEVLKSPSFNDPSFKLPVVMGKNTYGYPVVIDLASSSNVLIAGTTGSGKSMFVSAMLMSLISKCSPKKLRLVLIDPKHLELALYQRLPHLVIPIVTEPVHALLALEGTIEEMNKRISLFKEFGVKDIHSFNTKIKKESNNLSAKILKHYQDSETHDFELPYIVIVIDEFADLIMSRAGRSIEASVSKLAAKCTTYGIHIIMATQRPSTDVITGLIKANFHTRIAFRVFTKFDSHVILDKSGAEELLGKGDMLFKEGADLERLHAAYIDEEEIEESIKIFEGTPNYDKSLMEFMRRASRDLPNFDDQKFEKYDEAVNCVAIHRVASASLLQRRLSISYNRAADLIEEMERNGVVGPAFGSKPKKVLVSPKKISKKLKK
jgi:S-DNA-T family DNA segregation ATPase FtsK/SpoIIIE